MRSYRLLALLGIAGILALAIAFGVRATLVDRDADQLCDVLYTLIAGSGASVGQPGSPGFAYYQQHPEELAQARAQNAAFLAELPCDGP